MILANWLKLARVSQMIQKLSMVTRIVANQTEAVEFYTDKLEFVVRRDNQGPHGRFVTVSPEADTAVELVLIEPYEFDNQESERLSNLIGNDGGLIYEVDDCHETFEALRENGVEFSGEPKSMPWGTQAVALDQDGNEIVIQERPAGSE